MKIYDQSPKNLNSSGIKSNGESKGNIHIAGKTENSYVVIDPQIVIDDLSKTRKTYIEIVGDSMLNGTEDKNLNKDVKFNIKVQKYPWRFFHRHPRPSKTHFEERT